MENRESESELNECKKKLNKAHQTIEELKIKMTQDKKNYKWEIRELNKEKDALRRTILIFLIGSQTRLFVRTIWKKRILH